MALRNLLGIKPRHTWNGNWGKKNSQKGDKAKLGEEERGQLEIEANEGKKNNIRQLNEDKTEKK